MISTLLPVDDATRVAEARRLARDGNLSAYVADGLRRRILADRQRQYLAALDAEFGSLTEEELAEARRLWHEEV